MTVVSMCHISLGRVVRRPTFGLAGCTRSRGRRQPFCRTRRYQVEGEAQTLPPRVLSRETEHQLSNLTPHCRATTNRMRAGPPLRDQAPMPAKEGRRCDNEGRPARARQKSAGSGREKPVKSCYRRTPGLAPKDGQFVPQHVCVGRVKPWVVTQRSIAGILSPPNDVEDKKRNNNHKEHAKPARIGQRQCHPLAPCPALRKHHWCLCFSIHHANANPKASKN
jgi:hypothetical protein